MTLRIDTALPSIADVPVMIEHARYAPIKRHFSYRSYYVWADTQNLDQTFSKKPMFSYNRWNVFSVCDADYLQPDSDKSIFDKITATIEQKGIAVPQKIYMLTCPRVFGYAFNPVNFYCGIDDNTWKVLVVEINNTFGERHVYVVDLQQENTHDKAFHVSPFFDETGQYAYDVSLQDQHVNIAIRYEREGQRLFYASMQGSLHVRQGAGVSKYLSALNYLRILWQAWKLFYTHKLTVFTKPRPRHPDTLVGPKPNAIQALCMRLFLKLFATIQKGSIQIILPNEDVVRVGDPSSSQTATLEIHTYSFFPSVVWGGDIAFGDLYVDGSWDSPDVTRLLRVLAQNVMALEKKSSLFSSIAKASYVKQHRKRANTLDQAKKNIASHYDLGNAFFSLMLDSSMNYSSALYQHDMETLEKAQINKMQRLYEELHLGQNKSVLEIGTGWGGLSCYLAEKGLDVTTLTLSQRQQEWTQERVRGLKLDSRVQVLLKDYREMQGAFDGIVSIEMIEAVGREYLPLYFKKASDLLKTNGRFVLQGIVMAPFKYPKYAKGVDWIQQHIFPGSHIPTEDMVDQYASDVGMSAVGRIHMGQSYAKTLRAWRNNVHARKKAILDQGYSQAFIRQFVYYLQYCEAGFLEQHLDVVQWTFQKD